LQDANLNAIAHLQREFPQYLIGLSDHTMNLWTPAIARALGVVLVEDTILTWDMLEVCPKLLGLDDGRSSEGVLDAIQSLVVKEEARHDN